MKKILVTGAKGQLGKTFLNLISTMPEVDGKGIDLDELDLTDTNATADYFLNERYDIIVNCAAYTDVEKAEKEPERAYAGNALSIQNLALEAADKAMKIIHISTDYVFPGDSETPYIESDNTNPQTVYGKTKLEGERLLTRILPEAVVIRTAWLYSPFGRNFFKTMHGKAIKGEKVKVVNDQIGTPTSASDLASAILEIVTANNWNPGIYHYSNEGRATWFDFAREIYKLAGADLALVVPISTNEFVTNVKRPLFSVLDKTKIKSVFGFQIPKWEESLKKLMESNNN